MKGQWREVLEVYKNNPRALEAKVTKAEDTVLHFAVYVGQTNFLTTLLVNINEDGNTPLHLAAELGNVDICNTIAKRDPKLISCRNFECETPLLLAAIHGSKYASFFVSMVTYKTDMITRPVLRATGTQFFILPSLMNTLLKFNFSFERLENV
ncbi:hypothetical protein CR513_28799, partial [Mucuna pruriens]